MKRVTFPQAMRIIAFMTNSNRIPPPEPPYDLGISGSEVWNDILTNRKVGATQLAMVHNCCRIVDRLDDLSREVNGELTVINDKGDEVANPLLTEHRQQFLALRTILKDLGIDKLPAVAKTEENSFQEFLRAKRAERENRTSDNAG